MLRLLSLSLLIVVTDIMAKTDYRYNNRYGIIIQGDFGKYRKELHIENNGMDFEKDDIRKRVGKR